MRGFGLVFASAAMTVSVQAIAAPVMPAGYEAPLGGYTYEDSGGELTDGVIPAEHWNPPYENRYPFVGWQGINPQLTFSFQPNTTLGSAVLYFDDYGGGAGVTMPDGATITINGITYTGDRTANGTGASPITFNFGSGVITDTAVVNIDAGGEWTFMSEATFDSVAAVPEPGEWAMMAAGLGVVGFAAKRRRKRA